jgi:hypothetical protein
MSDGESLGEFMFETGFTGDNHEEWLESLLPRDYDEGDGEEEVVYKEPYPKLQKRERNEVEGKRLKRKFCQSVASFELQKDA